MNMRFLAFTFILGFLGPSTTAAQAQSCKIYFTVVESDSHLPGGSLAVMSPAQQKWWRKKGIKKFPGLCDDAEKAKYQIVWWRQVVSDNFVAKNVTDPRV